MSDSKNDITGSLEDYLETIYIILGRSSVARVRDIAEEMQVSPASVTPAMKRLAEKQLIKYSKRNYIEFTEKGLFIARRTMTRHNLLSRFLNEILGIDREQAENDACEMEHFLSGSSMEGLAAFFEFHAACPEFQILIDKGFSNCLEDIELMRLVDLEPGSSRRVARINAGQQIRRQLIDSGFIQGAKVILIRPGDTDLPFIVNLDGYDQKLSANIAECILVHPDTEETGEDDNEE
ncbi:MAG: metal-dependent transcriptional regulator [Candidatus Aegiribacteria sp.]|nr:metal-dependent transcriptional regulator [Candidatus Aegiribacteria sp.]